VIKIYLSRSCVTLFIVGIVISAIFGYSVSYSEVSSIKQEMEKVKAENRELEARIQAGFRVFSELERMSYTLSQIRVALLLGDYEVATFRANQFKESATGLSKYLKPEYTTTLEELVDGLIVAIEEGNEEAIEERSRALFLLVQILESEFGVREDVELIGEIDIKNNMRRMNHELARILSALDEDNYNMTKEAFNDFKKIYMALSETTPEAWDPYFRTDIVFEIEKSIIEKDKNNSLEALNKLSEKSCDKCHTKYR